MPTRCGLHCAIRTEMVGSKHKQPTFITAFYKTAKIQGIPLTRHTYETTACQKEGKERPVRTGTPCWAA